MMLRSSCSRLESLPLTVCSYTAGFLSSRELAVTEQDEEDEEEEPLEEEEPPEEEDQHRGWQGATADDLLRAFLKRHCQ
jgi:hypothetical protein